MSEEDQDFWSRNRWYIAGAFMVSTVVTVVAVLMYYGWLPGAGFLLHPIVLAVIFLGALGVAGVVIIYNMGSFGVPDFGGEGYGEKLTEKEAFALIKYKLFREENMFIENIVDKGAIFETGEEETSRLYMCKFERRYRNERVAVVLDLEQSISVDANDNSSVREKYEEIENVRIIREDGDRQEFKEDLESAVESMSKTRKSRMEVREFDPRTGRERTTVHENVKPSETVEAENNT